MVVMILGVAFRRVHCIEKMVGLDGSCGHDRWSKLVGEMIICPFVLQTK